MRESRTHPIARRDTDLAAPGSGHRATDNAPQPLSSSVNAITSKTHNNNPLFFQGQKYRTIAGIFLKVRLTWFNASGFSVKLLISGHPRRVFPERPNTRDNAYATWSPGRSQDQTRRSRLSLSGVSFSACSTTFASDIQNMPATVRGSHRCCQRVKRRVEYRDG